jgi:2-C-methyl-D-erythritol 4-phosphate cytidylyltransferase
MSLHGEPLAARAMAAFAGWCESVLVGPGGLDPSLPLGELCAGADRMVVHDPLCPLLTPAALARCAADQLPGVAVVGIRPVTDTVKRVEGAWLRDTLDRDGLAVLASPVVWGADLVAPLSQLLPTAGDLADLSGLVTALAGLCTLRGVEVPSAGRRVGDPEDLALLTVMANRNR